MPVCFQLTRKGETEPENLQSIDDRMWREIAGEEPIDQWICGWYNTVGCLLAMGRTWDEIRAVFGPESNLNKIIDFLEEHYEVNNWHEFK